MAQAQAYTAPSMAQPASARGDLSMDDFIQLLNSLALGPMYVQGARPRQDITMGGAGTGFPMQSGRISGPMGRTQFPEPDATKFQEHMVQNLMNQFQREPPPDPVGGTKPGISLDDFINVLGTLQTKFGQHSSVFAPKPYYGQAMVSRPGAQAGTGTPSSAQGNTPEDVQEGLARALSRAIELVVKYPRTFGGQMPEGGK